MNEWTESRLSVCQRWESVYRIEYDEKINLTDYICISLPSYMDYYDSYACPPLWGCIVNKLRHLKYYTHSCSTIINLKDKVRWDVYFHFAIGTVAELLLNAGGIVGERTGLWDLAQFFYICEIIAGTLILGFIQFIVWFIRIKKRY